MTVQGTGVKRTLQATSVLCFGSLVVGLALSKLPRQLDLPGSLRNWDLAGKVSYGVAGAFGAVAAGSFGLTLLGVGSQDTSASESASTTSGSASTGESDRTRSSSRETSSSQEASSSERVLSQSSTSSSESLDDEASEESRSSSSSSSSSSLEGGLSANESSQGFAPSTVEEELGSQDSGLESSEESDETSSTSTSSAGQEPEEAAVSERPATSKSLRSLKDLVRERRLTLNKTGLWLKLVPEGTGSSGLSSPPPLPRDEATEDVREVEAAEEPAEAGGALPPLPPRDEEDENFAPTPRAEATGKGDDSVALLGKKEEASLSELSEDVSQVEAKQKAGKPFGSKLHIVEDYVRSGSGEAAARQAPVSKVAELVKKNSWGPILDLVRKKQFDPRSLVPDTRADGIEVPLIAVASSPSIIRELKILGADVDQEWTMPVSLAPGDASQVVRTYTPLHHACTICCASAVETLLTLGARVDGAKEKNGKQKRNGWVGSTPLLTAVKRISKSNDPAHRIAKMLIENKADKKAGDIRSEDTAETILARRTKVRGREPSAGKGRMSVVDCIYKNNWDPIFKAIGSNHLSVDASLKGRPLIALATSAEVVSRLVGLGAEVDKTWEEELRGRGKTVKRTYTPLHFAASFDRLPVVHALLEAGAEPGGAFAKNCKETDGQWHGVTPMITAARRILKNPQAPFIYKALVAKGRYLDVEDAGTGLTCAGIVEQLVSGAVLPTEKRKSYIKDKTEELISELPKLRFPNKDERRKTVSKVVALLKKGANPNVPAYSERQDQERSLLWYAASMGEYELTLQALKMGADPDEGVRQGTSRVVIETPLQACQSKAGRKFPDWKRIELLLTAASKRKTELSRPK